MNQSRKILYFIFTLICFGNHFINVHSPPPLPTRGLIRSRQSTVGRLGSTSSNQGIQISSVNIELPPPPPPPPLEAKFVQLAQDIYPELSPEVEGYRTIVEKIQEVYTSFEGATTSVREYRTKIYQKYFGEIKTTTLFIKAEEQLNLFSKIKSISTSFAISYSSARQTLQKIESLHNQLGSPNPQVLATIALAQDQLNGARETFDLVKAVQEQEYISVDELELAVIDSAALGDIAMTKIDVAIQHTKKANLLLSLISSGCTP
jgi:hypothetical protein